MSVRLLPILFIALMTMTVIWLILISWLFRRLRMRHPPVYQGMGAPTVFWNNSMRNNWLFLKFLWSSRTRELGDRQIIKVVHFMRLFFVCYFALFVGIVCVFLTVVSENSIRGK